jgi:NodT family efflux transporter outer membrane factor (OMF) lipoprotein
MKKYLSIPTIFLAAIIINACRVSKDETTPKPSLPVAFRNASTTDSSPSIATIQWKDFFKDTSLQKLIDSAIIKNYNMQIALKNIELAHLVFKQSKLGNLPQAYAQITAGSTRYSDNSLDGLTANQYLGVPHIEDYDASVGLSWEADIWGKIHSKKNKALAAYLQTEEAKKVIQTNIVVNVAQGYYNLLMLDEQLAIARKNVLLNDSVLRIIHFQFDAGQVSYLAVQQAEAQKLSVAQLVPQFEEEIALQENAISVLSGILPDTIIRNAKLETTVVSDSLSTGVPADMVSYRPDVKNSELALQIANANVGIAKANLYPALTITASGGLNSFKASNWFNIPASLFGAVAGGLVEPLFEQNQLKTQYKISKVEREKTVIQFRETVLNALGEVSDALVKIEKLKEQQAIAIERNDVLQQAINNADMLFKNDMANYLEVITAQGNVLQSELDLATIKRSQLDANVQLYSALGGGWK